MRILAIETSCDETSAALLEATGGLNKAPFHRFSILSNVVISQVSKHRPFGGVVPNLAKREHERNLPFVLISALKESKLLKISNFQFSISKQIQNSIRQSADKIINSIFEHEPELLKRFNKDVIHLPVPDIDFIAVTKGPGLEPALWAGVNFARALSFLWNKPLLGVNHLEGHIYAVFLKNSVKSKLQITNYKKLFPALALIVSGGHTELVLIKDWLKYRILGETLDDAAGEAFDKVAKMLGLPYPGGPEIAAEAAKIRNSNFEIRNKLDFV